MRAARDKRVQPESAASQFSKHSLKTNYALSLACGGLRRPAAVNMRSYVRNTKSADAIMPMALDKTNACQRSECAHVRKGNHFVTFCAVSSRTRKTGSKTLPIPTSIFIPNPRHVLSLRFRVARLSSSSGSNLAPNPKHLTVTRSTCLTLLIHICLWF